MFRCMLMLFVATVLGSRALNRGFLKGTYNTNTNHNAIYGGEYGNRPYIDRLEDPREFYEKPQKYEQGKCVGKCIDENVMFERDEGELLDPSLEYHIPIGSGLKYNKKDKEEPCESLINYDSILGPYIIRMKGVQGGLSSTPTKYGCLPGPIRDGRHYICLFPEEEDDEASTSTQAVSEEPNHDDGSSETVYNYNSNYNVMLGGGSRRNLGYQSYRKNARARGNSNVNSNANTNSIPSGYRRNFDWDGKNSKFDADKSDEDFDSSDEDEDQEYRGTNVNTNVNSNINTNYNVVGGRRANINSNTNINGIGYGDYGNYRGGGRTSPYFSFDRPGINSNPYNNLGSYGGHTPIMNAYGPAAVPFGSAGEDEEEEWNNDIWKTGSDDRLSRHNYGDYGNRRRNERFGNGLLKSGSKTRSDSKGYKQQGSYGRHTTMRYPDDFLRRNDYRRNVYQKSPRNTNKRANSNLYPRKKRSLENSPNVSTTQDNPKNVGVLPPLSQENITTKSIGDKRKKILDVQSKFDKFFKRI